MPETSRRKQTVLNYARVHRKEPQFKETVMIIRADHLIVRQRDDNAFTILVRDPATNTEYVLSKTRISGVERTFTNLGRCVQFAVRVFGLRAIHFDLLDGPLADSDSE